MRTHLRRRRLGANLERAQCLGRTTPERSDLRAVVVVRDLARAMVELELLQRRECAIALLGDGEPPLLEIVRRLQPIVSYGRLTEERQRDDDRTRDRKRRADEKGNRHVSAKAPA